MRRIPELEFTAGLSKSAIERIRHRRMLAVSQLLIDLEAHHGPEAKAEMKNWEAVAPIFVKYGKAIFNAEADEIVKAAKDEATVERQLDELVQRVRVHIMGEEVVRVSDDLWEGSGGSGLVQ